MIQSKVALDWLFESTSEAGKYIRFSETGSCRRKWGYRILGHEPAPHAPGTLSNFELGHLGELVVLRRLQEEGYQMRDTRLHGDQPALKLSHPPRVGHSDGTILFHGEWMDLSIKTTNPFTWANMSQRGVYDAVPRYYKPALHYMMQKGMSNCYTVVMNLGSTRKDLLKETVEFNALNYLQCTESLKEAWGKIEAEELPARDHESQQDTECRYCEFLHLCFEPEILWVPEKRRKAEVVASEVNEHKEIEEARQRWLGASAQGDVAEADVEAAKAVFSKVLKKYSAKRLRMDGLTATHVQAKGRSGWDSKVLESLVVQHPEIEKARKPGSPYGYLRIIRS